MYPSTEEVPRAKQEALHHGFKKWEWPAKKWEWPAYHDGSAGQWKETKWDGYSIPREKHLAKTHPKAHNSCNYLHGNLTPIPPDFSFFANGQRLILGSGWRNTGKELANAFLKTFYWAKDCTLHALMADCQLQWKGFSHHFNPVRRSKFSWICLDGLVAEVATLFRGIVELLPASCLANKQ